jgi:hypothetical protein
MQQFMNGGVGRNLDTARKKPNQIIKTAEKYMGTSHCMGGPTKKYMELPVNPPATAPPATARLHRVVFEPHNHIIIFVIFSMKY